MHLKEPVQDVSTPTLARRFQTTGASLGADGNSRSARLGKACYQSGNKFAGRAVPRNDRQRQDVPVQGIGHPTPSAMAGGFGPGSELLQEITARPITPPPRPRGRPRSTSDKAHPKICVGQFLHPLRPKRSVSPATGALGLVGATGRRVGRGYLCDMAAVFVKGLESG